MPKKNFTKTIYKWRVRAAFPGIILTVVLAKPSLYSILGGVAICILGLLIRTWACCHIQKEKELTISGPYQYTRNPLYLGNLILGISIAVGSWSWWAFGIFSAYFLIFYPVVIKLEKEKMERLFPQQYANYKKKVPLFVPCLRSSLPSEKNKFSWNHYQKNKEQRSLITAAIFWIIMIGKMILF